MNSLNNSIEKQFPTYAAKELEQPSPNVPFPRRGACVCATAYTKPTLIQAPALIYRFVLLQQSHPTQCRPHYCMALVA